VLRIEKGTVNDRISHFAVVVVVCV
jgi:hypothetical protein